MSYVSTDIKKIIAEIIENKKEKGGVKNIYFVGCGGSLGALYPAKTFMEREAQVLRSAWINSNEFVHSTPKDFGENSIICLACHKGNTPETIQAAKLGKEKGAAVIILTWLEESEIIEFGDYIIRYTFDASLDHLAGDIDYAGEKTQCALLVAVELLAQTEGYENYEKFYEGLGMISNIIKNARKHVAERAEAFAEEYKNDCTPYAVNTHRLLVRGYRIPYEEAVEKVPDEKIAIGLPFQMKVLFIGLFILFLILFFCGVAAYVKKRKKKREKTRREDHVSNEK